VTTLNQDRESIIAAAELGDAPANTAVALLVDARKRAFDAEQKAQQLQAEPDALKAAHAWIKTSERLPEETCDVLGVVDGVVMPLNYADDEDAAYPWADEYLRVYGTKDVSHWMPLPEAPK